MPCGEVRVESGDWKVGSCRRLAFVLICAQLSTLGAANVITHSSEGGTRQHQHQGNKVDWKRGWKVRLGKVVAWVTA